MKRRSFVKSATATPYPTSSAVFFLRPMKIFSDVMGREANHSVQRHCGYVLVKEYDVERFYSDQKLLEIGEGTSEIQRIVVARLTGALS